MPGMDRILRSRWGWIVWWIALTPLALVIGAAVSGTSGPDPAKALVDGTGIWALRFLLASLAMTPLRLLTGLSGGVRYRRLLGLMAALYASVHLLAYVVFLLEGELGRLATELVKRPYIVVGFVAWMALMPLVVTSSRYWQRRLGAGWARLHKAVYGIVALALLHFMWLEKTGLMAMWPYALIGGGMLLVRVPVVKAWLNRSNRQRP
jgi:sulfoxide reductase heme-binding subunit YedZ